jgi:hypothetical protein
MDLNKIGNKHQEEVVDAILQTVAREFKGEPCEIWLSGITNADANKAADRLSSDEGNRTWSFQPGPTAQAVPITRLNVRVSLNLVTKATGRAQKLRD